MARENPLLKDEHFVSLCTPWNLKLYKPLYAWLSMGKDKLKLPDVQKNNFMKTWANKRRCISKNRERRAKTARKAKQKQNQQQHETMAAFALTALGTSSQSLPLSSSERNSMSQWEESHSMILGQSQSSMQQNVQDTQHIQLQIQQLLKGQQRLEQNMQQLQQLMISNVGANMDIYYRK